MKTQKQRLSFTHFVETFSSISSVQILLLYLQEISQKYLNLDFIVKVINFVILNHWNTDLHQTLFKKFNLTERNIDSYKYFAYVLKHEKLATAAYVAARVNNLNAITLYSFYQTDQNFSQD